MFISFEANEGAGKTTQVALLVEALRSRGHDVVRTREPGGSPGAEEIRSLVVQGDPDRWSAMTELLLFNAARRDHLERTIRPALAEGKIVICDRYVGSTLALQVAGGACRDQIIKLHQLACDGQMPDLTLYLDIDPEVSLARGMSRNSQASIDESRFELKGGGFHDRVSKEFARQAKEYGWARIDADQSIENVHADILRSIEPLLLKKSA